MDDIIVYSKSFKEHLYHFQLIFDRLTEYSCQLCLEKCYFAANSINYLGHVVSSRGIQNEARTCPGHQQLSLPAKRILAFRR